MLTRAQRAAPRTCSVCMETKPQADFFPPQTPTTSCEHPVQTCTECLRQWFTTCLDTHYQPRVACPNCPSILNGYAELSKASTNEDYARYRYIFGRITRSSNPQWKFCLSPSCNSPGQRHPDPQADNPQTQQPSNADICQCHICKSRSCVHCDKPWHNSLTCEEFQEKMEDHTREDELSELTKWKMEATGKAKECPNCGCLIEVSSASTKFSCARCLHAFVDARAKRGAAIGEANRLGVPKAKAAKVHRERKVAFLLPEERMAAGSGTMTLSNP